MRKLVLPAAVIPALLTLQALILRWQGRTWLCTCESIRFWVGDINSRENSQQVADWYSFTHIEHGFIFYGLLWLIARKRPRAWRLFCAVMIEGAWEVLENSQFVIERYRQQALANGYVGDSILNSISDNVSMMIGFGLASVSPVWLVLALGVAAETALAFIIRDNLTLNIIQLIHPFEFIGRWQSSKPL